jgi:hypothetical protein
MKTILFALLLSISPIFTNSNIKHDYYFSSTTIEHNKQNESLEITSTYYTDDLEKAVEKEYNIKLALGTKKEHKEADKYMKKYFQENFKLVINGKILEYEYIGKEVEIEKTYNYIEVMGGVPALNKINIESRMLFNVARRQENIFKIKNNNTTKSITLYYKRPKGEIVF